MNEAEFDCFAEEYAKLHAANIKLSGEQPDFFAQYKVQDVSTRAEFLQIDARNILDFGSGVGNSIPHFRRLFPRASLYCADVSNKSLQIAEGRFPDAAQLRHITDASLSSISERFDILFSACVFHHIPHEEHLHWVSELRNVASPGAMLALFEHNPLNPLTTHAVNTCPFDANAKLIFAHRLRAVARRAGWREVEVAYRIFFPHRFARFRQLEARMTKVPLGAQYAVYGRA